MSYNFGDLAFDETQVRAEREQRRRDEHALFLGMVGVAAGGFALLFMLFSQLSGWFAAIGIGGLVAIAGAASGGLLGFIFSVPRILTKDVTKDVSAEQGAIGSSSEKSARLLGSNTNLERISEWLTTMLVGVGLSQIGSVGTKIKLFSDFLATNGKVFDKGTSAGALPVAGPFLLVFGLVGGFVFFYIYTRIYLSPLFQHVEEILNDNPSVVEQRLAGQKKLEVGAPDIKIAAAELAATSQNPSMELASKSETLSVDQSLDVLFNLLYAQDGYERAIALGNTLVNTPATELPRFWFLMCAAFGQKHHARRAASASAEELIQIRSSVLDAARQAVRRDVRYKARLRALLSANQTDNDLQDFANDSDFLRIIAA